MTTPIGKVFVSHSSSDKDFVDSLVADLARREVPVWYDKFDLRVGDSVSEGINDGLSQAKYFLIVLSKSSVQSRWVKEELSAALMQQVAAGGTFILPVILEECQVPPLLKHRRYADFRSNYDRGLEELLGVWGKDREASLITDKPLYPWPDIASLSQDSVYLFSTRFDKFFRMDWDLNATAERTIDYIVDTLKLPWNKDVPQLGMKWSFSYKLIFKEQGIGLSKSLCEIGVSTGSVLKMGISGTYEDVWEKESKEMWDGTKMYDIAGVMRHDVLRKENIRMRGPLTAERLKELADACFSHV